VATVECANETPARVDRDEQLVESLRRGEPSAADLLVSTYQSRAYRLAIRITGNAQDAEEVVQDAFVSVIRKIDFFRGDSAFGSWLYRIVANRACQTLRRRRTRGPEVMLGEALAAVDHSFAAVDDRAAGTELRLAMSAAIEKLPAHYCAALVMRDVDGSSLTDVAEALRVTVATAKTRVHRARLSVRKRLTEAVSPPRFPAPCPQYA
jgi:RNA polymerase sigma-70 factor, ECF subfamily